MESNFERIVEEEFETIPSAWKQRMKNVALLIEDEPDTETRKQEGLSEGETLLGLYQGIPATARGDLYGVGPTLPDSITLFRLPILELAGDDMEAIRTVVRETLWHEIAHHFGFSEEEVERREAEASNRFSEGSKS